MDADCFIGSHICISLIANKYNVLIIDSLVNSTLDKIELKWKEKKSICVVLSSKGYPDKFENNILLKNLGSKTGISAMSISDMTEIPRATIIRKCKYLLKKDLIQVNKKKQYILTTMNFRAILPYQTEIFKYKAKFIRKVLNLLVIS